MNKEDKQLYRLAQAIVWAQEGAKGLPTDDNCESICREFFEKCIEKLKTGGGVSFEINVSGGECDVSLHYPHVSEEADLAEFVAFDE